HVTSLSWYLLPSCRIFCYSTTVQSGTYSLSLHDALPIWKLCHVRFSQRGPRRREKRDEVITVRSKFVALIAIVLLDAALPVWAQDRKSTRLNSSHVSISYAVFCLKKKNNIPSQFYIQHVE